MAKQGEIEYLAKLGPQGAEHALGKPFSDAQCGAMLADLAGIFMMLPPPPARVLDLGCGSGWTSVFFARRGYDVVGQDIAPDMIALAERNREQANAAGLRFLVADYEALQFRDEFDAAVFYDALHHAVDPAAALAGAWRALKPGGILVTVEPGTGHAASEAARNAIAAFDVTERDMPPRMVARLGKQAGFRRARVYPMPKTLAALHYGQPPAWWPRPLDGLYGWVAATWVTVLRRQRYGGMVVLVK